MKDTVANNLADFWRKKELERGRIIPVVEVAKETHLDWETVNNLKEGKTKRFDSHVLGKICRYFDVPEGEPVPFLLTKYEVTSEDQAD